MTKEKLAAVISEAERFLKKARDLRSEMAKPEVITHGCYGVAKGHTRRASMDLTRALADLRRYE